jgi:hypothetical protein
MKEIMSEYGKTVNTVSPRSPHPNAVFYPSRAA